MIDRVQGGCKPGRPVQAGIAPMRLIVDAGPLIGWLDAVDAHDAIYRTARRQALRNLLDSPHLQTTPMPKPRSLK